VVTFSRAFVLVPSVQITAISSTAVFPVATVKSTTAFTVKIFNSSGVAVSGVIDWEATGP